MPKKNTTEDTVNNVIQTAVKDANDGIQPKQKISKFLGRVGYKKLSVIILVILAAGGIYGSYYFYTKYTAIKANPNLEAQKESERLVLALGRLMELPSGETPSIAAILDKEKLKDQPFFQAAENGDRLFTYNKAMIAILYRPSTNKIVNITQISVNQPQDLVEEAKEENKTPNSPQ